MKIDQIKAITMGVYAIGVKDEANRRFSGLIVDALVPFVADPAMIVVSVYNGTYSKELLLKEKHFSISVLGENIAPYDIASLGYQTGRHKDKWKGLDFFVENGLPFLSQAVEVMEAKVVHHYELADHTLFIAEVIREKTLKEEPILTYSNYQKKLKEKVIQSFKQQGENTMKEQWVCKVCGYVYDGETPFEELPEDWTCPLCGVGKDDFEKQSV